MKWPHYRLVCAILCIGIVLSGCGSDQNYASPQPSYKEMKSMVVDILKSDEGRKAVEEAMTSQGGGSTLGGNSGGTMGMKMLSSTATPSDLKTAVKDTLTAPEYQKEFEKIMTDPAFAGEFAKAISKKNKELHLQLIKDPSYQKSMQEMFKSPEVSAMLLDMTKSPEYRKQTMTVMQEAMQNPLFRLEVLNLLKTVVQEELQPEEKKKSGGGGGQGGESSGQGEEQSG
ncbi:spore germination lipoprotein GerD [Paenibacillus sp. P96]|uniref:Spore germination lipoprotein GerD n=1 Tax=Paenibacillus zeirhizosphaerae TaxID=2987519 RepID=A0ABT9FME2_9BACL|nr:spore germination lipoprotein GerD [Paenibacillus sp. P96]MDP4095913.1 spore germination lipoprotein GerD [Paenibacillus sp. P96]